MSKHERILIETKRHSLVPTYLHHAIRERITDVVIDVVRNDDDGLPQISVRRGVNGQMGRAL